VSRLSRQCGILNISQPYRSPRSVTAIALLFTLIYFGFYKTLKVSFYSNPVLYEYYCCCFCIKSKVKQKYTSPSNTGLCADESKCISVHTSRFTFCFTDAREHATSLPIIQAHTYLLRSPPDLLPPGSAAEMFLLRLARLPFLCVGAV
jgi:hypothetical protein